MAKVGLIGAGGMGATHARLWRSIPGVELQFHDPAGETSVDGCKDPGSIDALIRFSDAVDICLPTDMHCEVAEAALKAGKHVFLEKPATRTSEQAEGLGVLARQVGKHLAVGMVVRSFPEYLRANQTIKAGTIGKPGAVRMRRGGSPPSGVYGWFRDPVRSGGILMDLAIHDFDWLAWTFGDPKRLFSKLVRNAQGEYALTTLTFASGVIAHVESSWMDPSGFRTAFEVCGSEGMLEFDSRNVSSLRWSTSTSSHQEQNFAANDDPYLRQLEAFHQAVLGEGEPLVSLEESLLALRMCEAANWSAESGRVYEF